MKTESIFVYLVGPVLIGSAMFFAEQRFGALGLAACVVLLVIPWVVYRRAHDKKRIALAAKEFGWRNVVVSSSAEAIAGNLLPGWRRRYKVIYLDHEKTPRSGYCAVDWRARLHWHESLTALLNEQA